MVVVPAVLLAWCVCGLSVGVLASRAVSTDAGATLNVVFNAGGTISATLADGTQVGSPQAPGTVIPPGSYTVHLNDSASVLHLFHLFGPGVNLSINPLTAGPDGETEFDMYFQETFLPSSTYVFQDDYQPSSVHEVFSTSAGSAAASGSATNRGTPSSTGQIIGSSSVTGTKPTSGTTAGSAGTAASVGSTAFRGVLLGSVNASGELHLTFQGKAVGSLKAGRYTVKVTDGSARNGFVLQERNHPALSLVGASFVGSRSRTVRLSAGQWFFYSTFISKKTYFIVIA
jgi:hypothetical protein